MNKNFNNKYLEIQGLKSRRGEFTTNDHLFGCMALAYAFSSYSDKYKLLNNHYDDIVSHYYGPYDTDNLDVKDLLDEIETIRVQQDYSVNLRKSYDEVREDMIRHIMNFEPTFDRKTASKVFDMYYAIFLGGLLNSGDEKISDRAISNLLLFRLTKEEYGSSYNANEYARYMMPKYFAKANDRLNRVRKGKTYNEVVRFANMHRHTTNKANYFEGMKDFRVAGLDEVYREHDCMELNLNKVFLGKKIKQTDLFANPDYRTLKNIFPEMRSIIYGESTKREQINEYLMDFVDRMLPYHSIDGAYTVRYTDTDYKLVMVTKDRDEYNRLLEGLATLLSSLNKFNNKVSGVSFTIMPVFAPYLSNEDYICDPYKESLLDSDTILYDKKRFLRKTKGKIREEFKEREAARQYVKRD